MSFTERHFDELRAFYDDFEQARAALPQPKRSCGSCGKCCESPVFMTLSDLEFEYAMRAARAQHLPIEVHFENIEDTHVKGRNDKRVGFDYWACPFYSKSQGCRIYEHSPLACRVFGPWSQEPIPWKFCVYVDSVRVYKSPSELPLWERFITLLRDSGAQRGYIYPDQTLYYRPAVELLLGIELPWSPWRNLRLDF
jgi:Fe-S-cluster containining protein